MLTVITFKNALEFYFLVYKNINTGYIRPMSGYICVLFISKTTYIVACMLCEPSSYPTPPSVPQSRPPRPSRPWMANKTWGQDKTTRIFLVHQGTYIHLSISELLGKNSDLYRDYFVRLFVRNYICLPDMKFSAPSPLIGYHHSLQV